ncbi:alpha,alpha-trehalose-phosphate synthase (UDP-forming) [Streptomyces xiaopingdaonensis]|uniref:alpha,alpha-trehalose-phosphate synthase (UDP-forming) n=1 Tax=Streptomyces xiaopingdaonensis TaxID=1565415 RepID=UPI0004948DAC|nr:trehalose-6-phosphate synthase [Streptomyces xiaopingdaonensis]
MVAAAAEGQARVLVASNRGPVSYSFDDSAPGTGRTSGDSSPESRALTVKRGGGGLVSGLSAIGSDADAIWVCAALSEGDREAARRSNGRLDTTDTAGQAVRMLQIPTDVFAGAYNGIANSVLWFVHHMLYQTPLEPAFDSQFSQEWEAYEIYNKTFADALAAEAAQNAVVLVQDYHLSLVPALLREARPDLRIGHFSHTPWAPPDYFAMLPDAEAESLLRGILGADRAGFLTSRWAQAFADCCARVLGAKVSRHGDELQVDHEGGTTRLGVHALGADGEFLNERAHRSDVDERIGQLRAQIGEAQGVARRTVVRVDRTELSKNIVRGLYAFRRLLADRPEWRERVVHLAFAYPSRQDLAIYRDYTDEVARVAEEINSAFGRPDWTPVILHVQDDFPRSLAAYRIADVALVNPIRDGMNLVAKEVPVVSDEGCALVLSRESGAAAELADDSYMVNPFDVEGTARALADALKAPEAEKKSHTQRLAAAATALPPTDWFLGQLEALKRMDR